MKNSAQVTDFLLAGRKLKSHSIVSLLLSSSFGLNAIFYAAWLGYAIGMWALLIQAAWSISFFLLIPASKQFTNIASLHDFLGQQFGSKTKLLSALCSIVGIMYFVAWEVSINVSTITPLLHTSQSLPAGLFIGCFALITISYTLLFGLRGNAVIDSCINLVKLIILTGMYGISLHHFVGMPSETIYKALFPTWSTIVTNLGILGFATNIIFNLAWQFVDNSSWQSIIGGSKNSTDATSRNLKYSGFVIFLTVNLMSTLIGISLAHVSTITPDNILSTISGLMPQYGELVSTGIIILSIGSLMSVVDGMLLSLALTLNTDIIPKKFLRTFNPRTRMKLIQASIVLFGLIAIWGISLILKAFHVNLFDFLYIIVISQLSLTGPVLFGLYTNSSKSEKMWMSIIAALGVGFGSLLIGGLTDNKMLMDGAGTFVVIISIIGAWIISRFS